MKSYKSVLISFLLLFFLPACAKNQITSKAVSDGLTPLSCLTISDQSQIPKKAAWYMAVQFKLVNNCKNGEADTGVLFKLDANNDPKATSFLSDIEVPFAFDTLSPWLNGFLPSADIISENDAKTISVLLAHKFSALTVSFGVNFNKSMSQSDVSTFLAALGKDVHAYSLKDIPVKLTVNNGAMPAGFSTAAFPKAYPSIKLQWQRVGSTDWLDIDTHQFTEWEQNWEVHGLVLGKYRLIGQEVTITNGAVFAPIKLMDEMDLIPFNVTAVVPYQQTTDASGSLVVTMPAAPTGDAPPTVSASLIDEGTGNTVSTVSGLAWGQSITVKNLAPSEKFSLKFAPIYYVNGSQIDKDALTVGTVSANTITIKHAITVVPSKTASFILQLPSTPVPTSILQSQVIFSGAIGSDAVAIEEKLPADSASHSLRVPSEGTFTYSTPNIAYKSGYFVPTTHGGAMQAVNTINFNYFALPAVSGWPSDHIAMGNLTADNNGKDDGEGLAARVKAIDAIFKYAGSNGGGDRGLLVYPKWTQQTIDEAASLSKAKGKPVIPVMVVYTAQMSGGTNFDDLNTQDNVAKHFANLAMTVHLLNNAVAKGDIAGGSIVLNPDLLGMIAQNYLETPLSSATGSVNLTAAAKVAACVVGKNPTDSATYATDYTSCSADSGSVSVPTFPNSFRGWVAANNWLSKTFGGSKVSYGWMMNDWSAASHAKVSLPCATSSATWLHFADSASQVQQCYTARNVAVLNEYGVYAGGTDNPKPQYVAFDKYEMDVVPGALGIGYLFNHHDWVNYYTAIKQVSEAITPTAGEPVMLFQLPGGHIRTMHDVDARKGHISTAPDYVFGNPALGADFSGAMNLNNYLNTTLSNSTYNCTANNACLVKAYLTYGGQNWTEPHFDTLLESHVFAILWGGGTGPTTSIAKYPTDDGGWLATKIEEYLSTQS